MGTPTWVALACLLVSADSAAQAPPPPAPVLLRVAEIPLPGPAVRFDYQSIDTSANRLYLSHMNAGKVVVFDLKSRQVVASIGDLPRTTGVCVVPALGKLYVSVPGHHHVAVIDTRTLRVMARVGPIGFPDGIAYAPNVNRIYVSDESGGGELVIDGSSNRVVATVPLRGEAGNTVYDPGSGHILVAVQTTNELAEIDPRTNRVIARHPLAGAAHPHGLAVDTSLGLLFVANEGNATLQTVDLRTMNVVASDNVGEDPDVLAFDPGWRQLYVASEAGGVSVFAERDGRLVLRGNLGLSHAHTVSVDPRTHLVYLPLENVGGRPVLRIMSAQQP